MMSGLAAMTGTRDKPQRVGSSANDIMGGMFGVIAILAALFQKRGGAKGGAEIRIGLFENCLFLVAQHMVEYEMTGTRPRSMPEREHAWPIYDIFETAGGERIFIGVVTEGHWQSFCREFGLQDFLDDPDLAHHHRPDPGARTESFRAPPQRSRAGTPRNSPRRWTGSISASRRSTAPRICSTIPHVLRPGGLVNNINADGEAFRVPALPIEWNGADIGEGLKVPVLGADTSAVRAELERPDVSPTAKPAVRLA